MKKHENSLVLTGEQEHTFGGLLNSVNFYHVFYPSGKSGRSHLLRYQCVAVDDYSFGIDALKLKPS